MLLTTNAAHAGRVIPDDPKAYENSESLGDLLKSRGTRPIHIIYVHGMAATGSHNSQKFRDALKNHPISTQQLATPLTSPPDYDASS